MPVFKPSIVFRVWNRLVPPRRVPAGFEPSRLERLRDALARQPLPLTTTLAVLLLVVAATQAGTPVRADASSPLTADEAWAIVSPLYMALNRPAIKEVGQLIGRATTRDWQSCGANDACLSRDAAIAAIERMGAEVPDLAWSVVEIEVAGPRTIVVRGEATGTPVGEFRGMQPSGRRFRVMSIDIHTVRDGKIARSYHVEDWAGASRQLGAP